MVKNGRVAGVVTNWVSFSVFSFYSLVRNSDRLVVVQALVTRFGHDTQSCMDPNVLESKVLRNTYIDNYLPPNAPLIHNMDM